MMNQTRVEELAGRTSVADRVALTTVLRLAARMLASHTGPACRLALAGAVGDAVLKGVQPGLGEPQTLYHSVAAATGLDLPSSIELGQSALLVLAHAIGPDARRHMCSELSPAWARLLEDPHDVPSDRRPAPTGSDGRSLAHGRPGASTSLGSAAPLAGQRDSIACSDDPHGDRKLSGAEGPVTPDRTLAGARR